MGSPVWWTQRQPPGHYSESRSEGWRVSPRAPDTCSPRSLRCQVGRPGSRGRPLLKMSAGDARIQRRPPHSNAGVGRLALSYQSRGRLQATDTCTPPAPSRPNETEGICLLILNGGFQQFTGIAGVSTNKIKVGGPARPRSVGRRLLHRCTVAHVVGPVGALARGRLLLVWCSCVISCEDFSYARRVRLPKV